VGHGCSCTSTSRYEHHTSGQINSLTGFSQSLERCYALDDTLTQLAHTRPNTKFLRARAAALGFASSAPASRGQPRASHRASRLSTLREDDDDDDPYGPASSDEDNTAGIDEDEVDTDVLPTLLAYHDGELVHTWVRIDWEAEAVGGVEELLERYRLRLLSQVYVADC
jgi:hypothetical protein